MTDAYLVDVLPIKDRNEWLPTIDFVDGNCWTTVKRFKDKNEAQKDLDEAIKKFEVKLVPDPRLISPALSKEERDWVYECKKKNKKYKDALLKSRIERRRLTQKEMKNVKIKEMK